LDIQTEELCVQAELITTDIPDVKILKVARFGDERGFFAETFHQSVFEDLGLPTQFVQDNHSRSCKDVLRGFHYQDMRAPQAKLVRCTLGKVLDVVVDLRVDSPTFGQTVSQVLDADNMLQLYAPIGFGHAFLTLTEVAEVQYKCTEFYDPKAEGNILWNDPDIQFEWPIASPILSQRDEKAPTLSEYLQNPAFR
jgi:dTDP-4-dehydrorhamnose 3,5-epimerase